MEARAGSYSQNFNAVAVGATALGDGSTVSASAGSITTSVQRVTAGNNALQMMLTGFGGNNAAYKLPDLDPSVPIQSFNATFKVKMNKQSAGAVPGAGWSLNFGEIIPNSGIPNGNGAGEGGFVMSGGLTIAWDIYNNGGSDAPSIEVFADAVSVGNSPRTFTYRGIASASTRNASESAQLLAPLQAVGKAMPDGRVSLDINANW